MTAVSTIGGPLKLEENHWQLHFPKPMKNGGWETTFLSKKTMFCCCVSFGEGRFPAEFVEIISSLFLWGVAELMPELIIFETVASRYLKAFVQWNTEYPPKFNVYRP